jgi:hypothetical protein
MAMAAQRLNQWIGVTPLNSETEWQIAALRAIHRLAAMDDNWDGYGSPRIQIAAKEGAGRLLCTLAMCEPPTPHIAPVPGGGLQFEWEHDGRELELEILPDGNLEFLATEESGEMVEGPLKAWNAEVPSLIHWLLTGGRQ